MNQKQIKKDWDSRGYSFGIFKDPPGKIWAEFVMGQTNLLYCQRERLRLKAIHSSLRLVMRFFIPAKVVHTVRNIGKTNNVWYYGYKNS